MDDFRKTLKIKFYQPTYTWPTFRNCKQILKRILYLVKNVL